MAFNLRLMVSPASGTCNIVALRTQDVGMTAGGHLPDRLTGLPLDLLDQHRRIGVAGSGRQVAE